MSTPRVALISGAGGSIGAAVAMAFASEGYSLALGDIDAAAAAATADRVRADRGRALHGELDVRDEASARELVERAVQEFGTINTLFTGSGILRQGPSSEMSVADFRDVLDVNVLGTWIMARAAAPALRKATEASIITLGSVSGSIAVGGGAAYAASKGAVTSLTYSLAAELAPDSVRVVSIAPSWVDGGFTDVVMRNAEDPDALRRAAESVHLLRRMATPADIGDAAVFLASSRASFITGTVLFVDGGFMVGR